MIRLEKEKLILELDHPFPKELIYDLKMAIISFLELPRNEVLSEEEYENSKSTLLFLLRDLVEAEDSNKLEKFN